MTRTGRAGAAVLSLLLAVSAFAIDAGTVFSDPAMQQRYERLTRELRCLQCQNETLADSNAPLAADLRREVHAMIAAGRTDAEIRQFLVDRYGDFVLYRPRMSPAGALLWAMPALLLVGGGLIAWVFIRRKAAEAREESDDHGAGA